MIFNSDGGEVEQCGNGARCFVRFVHEKELTEKRQIYVETLAGVIEIQLEENGEVSVDMGVPRFEPEALPMLAEQQSDQYSLNINDSQIQYGAVSMGNPHVVLQVDDVDTAPVNQLGAAMENHELFPERVNVGFMQIVDRDNIRLRVFERGTGETLACGTGACAAVVLGISRGVLNNRVTVELPGGNLLIEWQGARSSVKMTGPAQTVYDGQINI